MLQSIDSYLNRRQMFLDFIDYTDKATHGNYSLRKCPQQCYCNVFLGYYQWLLNGMYTVLVLLNNYHFISFSKRLKINWAITLLEIAISKLKEYSANFSGRMRSSIYPPVLAWIFLLKKFGPHVSSFFV